MQKQKTGLGTSSTGCIVAVTALLLFLGRQDPSRRAVVATDNDSNPMDSVAEVPLFEFMHEVYAEVQGGVCSGYDVLVGLQGSCAFEIRPRTGLSPAAPSTPVRVPVPMERMKLPHPLGILFASLHGSASSVSLSQRVLSWKQARYVA